MVEGWGVGKDSEGVKSRGCNTSGVVRACVCVCVCVCVHICIYVFLECVLCRCVCMQWSHSELISSTSLGPPSISKGASRFVSWSPIRSFCSPLVSSADGGKM